ncbi:MAG: hypothetical protein NTY77_12460 [Elusimicrobia bacterium]|nr:hypothetical protein [Elusimicrobiota bacterium]
MIPRAGWARAFVPLLGFLLVSCAITFPAIRHLGDRAIGIPAHPNLQADIFFIETISASMRDGHYIRWFTTDRTSFPFGQTFNSRERHSLHLYLASLLRFAPPPFGTHNLAMMIFLALNGFAMYLLAREFFASRAVSFASGILFMLNSYTLVKATIGSLQKVTQFWLPLYVVFLLRLRRGAGRGDFLLALLFLQLMMLNYPVYAYYALLFTVALMIYDLVQKKPAWTFPGQGALLIGSFLACSIGIDHMLGLSGPQGDYRFFHGLPPHLIRTVTFDLLHPFGFHLPPPTDLSMGLSISLCIAAAFAAMRGKGLTRFFFVCAVLFIVLASGPYLFNDLGIVHILGRRVILPHYFLYELTPATYGEGLLGPVRALPIAALCLALLGGTALAELTKDRGRAKRAALILCFLAVYLTELHIRFPGLFPLRVCEPRIPHFFTDLRKTPGGALLNLPLEKPPGQLYSFYSTISGRKMMNPHGGGDIAVPFPAAAESMSMKRDFIARLAEWDVRYIIIHRDLVGPMGLAARPGPPGGGPPRQGGPRRYGPEQSPRGDSAFLRDKEWLERLCGKPVDYQADAIIVYTVPMTARTKEPPHAEHPAHTMQ